MNKLYTVDRLGTLTPNQVCRLTRYDDIEPEMLSTHVTDMFPEGVSQHGNAYFLDSKQEALIASPALELTFEYARRALYPDRPSRFQSMFAVDSLESAKSFMEKHPNDKSSIWEVEAETVFRANMNMLYAGNSILATSYRASVYWAGQDGPDDSPFWEYLLKCPVTIKNRIT